MIKIIILFLFIFCTSCSNGNKQCGNTTSSDSVYHVNGAIYLKKYKLFIEAEKYGMGLAPLQTDTVDSNTVSALRGIQYKLILPGVGKIWANPETNISISFKPDIMLSVTGEIYIETNENSDSLVIRLKEDILKAVLSKGSVININTYDNDSAYIISCKSGSVRIIGNYGDCYLNTMIKPGEKMEVLKYAALGRSENIDRELIGSWKDAGFYHIDQDNIVTELRQLGRWYNKRIVFSGEIPHTAISASWPYRMALEDRLRLTEEARHVKCQVIGNKVIVTPEK